MAEAVWDLQARDLPAHYGLDANSALEVATRLAYLGGGLVSAWYQCTPSGGGPVWSNSTWFSPQRARARNIVGVPK